MPSSDKHSRKDKDKQETAAWHVKTLDEIREEKKRRKEEEEKKKKSKESTKEMDTEKRVSRQRKHSSGEDNRMEDDEDDVLNIQPPQAKPGSQRDTKHRKEDKRKHGRSHSRDHDRKRPKRSRSADKKKSRSKDSEQDRERARERDRDRVRDRDANRDSHDREKKARKDPRDESRQVGLGGRSHQDDARQTAIVGSRQQAQQDDLRQIIIDRREEPRQASSGDKLQREAERRARDGKKEGDRPEKEIEQSTERHRREERHREREKEEKRGKTRDSGRRDTGKERSRSRRDELVEEKKDAHRPSSKERVTGSSRHDDGHRETRLKKEAEDQRRSSRDKSPHSSSREEKRKREERMMAEQRDSDHGSDHRKSNSSSKSSSRSGERDRKKEVSEDPMEYEAQVVEEEEEEQGKAEAEEDSEEENASSSSEEEEGSEEEEESSEAESESEEEGEEASSSEEEEEEEEEESAEEGEASAASAEDKEDSEMEEGEHKDSDEEEEEEEEEEGEEEEEEEEEESGEEKSESDRSESESESESGSEEGSEKSASEASHHEDMQQDAKVTEEKHESAPDLYAQHLHAKSKFDDSPSPLGGNVEPEEEEPEEPSDTEYLQDTPPASPIQLEEKLPPYLPAIQGCRSVEEFQCLNRIAEGTYGVVYRAREKKKVNEIVALKRLKMEKEKEGFPITSLREISTLLKAQHRNIVTVREIVVGSNMDKIYIVMDYVEHDLKSLMETMKQPFTIGETKCLMIQLLRGVHHLHDNWILHRDLKTSNLLLNHQGCLKIGDFGLAREYGSPIKPYTSIVVTLWYRAPELLLGTKVYATPVDMWSVGCIFAEFLTMKPIFNGRSEIDQLNRIFKELGTPSEKIWVGYNELPAVKKTSFTNHPYNNLRSRFGTYLTDMGFELLNRFLTYDPARRISAEEALKSGYFNESPQLINESMFPTWPAKSEMVRTNKPRSPQAPEGGAQFAKLEKDEQDSGFRMAFPTQGSSAQSSVGFSLKF